MLKSIGSNWAVTIATIASTYVLLPFVLESLGSDGYGTWSLVTSMTGYLALLTLGVPMASVRYLAQHAAEGEGEKLNEVIGSCAGLYLLMGGVALVVGLGELALFDSLYAIPEPLRSEARAAFAVMVVYAVVGFVALLPEGILAAHQDFVPRNAIRVGGLVLRLALTLALLSVKASLVVLAAIQVACLLLEFAASSWLIRRRFPHVRLRLDAFSLRSARTIASFSVYVLFLHAGARLIFQSDALVIGAVLGVGLIPFYAVANSLIVYLLEFVIAIAAVVMPTATRLAARGDRAELRAMFLKWSKIAFSLTTIACLLLVVLGPRLIGWWVGDAFEEPAGRVLQILVVSALAFLPVRGVALPILMGLGKPKLPTLCLLAAGVMNVGLSVLLARPLGLSGVALGTAIPNLLFAGVVLVVACRELGITVPAYLRYTVWRVVLGSVPVGIVLVGLRMRFDIRSAFALLVTCAAATLVAGVIGVLFVYRKDPYADVLAKLSRFRQGVPHDSVSVRA